MSSSHSGMASGSRNTDKPSASGSLMSTSGGGNPLYGELILDMGRTKLKDHLESITQRELLQEFKSVCITAYVCPSQTRRIDLLSRLESLSLQFNRQDIEKEISCLPESDKNELAKILSCGRSYLIEQDLYPMFYYCHFCPGRTTRKTWLFKDKFHNPKDLYSHLQEHCKYTEFNFTNLWDLMPTDAMLNENWVDWSKLDSGLCSKEETELVQKTLEEMGVLFSKLAGRKLLSQGQLDYLMVLVGAPHGECRNQYIRSAKTNIVRHIYQILERIDKMYKQKTEEDSEDHIFPCERTYKLTSFMELEDETTKYFTEQILGVFLPENAARQVPHLFPRPSGEVLYDWLYGDANNKEAAKDWDFNKKKVVCQMLLLIRDKYVEDMHSLLVEKSYFMNDQKTVGKLDLKAFMCETKLLMMDKSLVRMNLMIIKLSCSDYRHAMVPVIQMLLKARLGVFAP